MARTSQLNSSRSASVLTRLSPVPPHPPHLTLPPPPLGESGRAAVTACSRARQALRSGRPAGCQVARRLPRNIWRPCHPHALFRGTVSSQSVGTCNRARRLSGMLSRCPRYLTDRLRLQGAVHHPVFGWMCMPVCTSISRAGSSSRGWRRSRGSARQRPRCTLRSWRFSRRPGCSLISIVWEWFILFRCGTLAPKGRDGRPWSRCQQTGGTRPTGCQVHKSLGHGLHVVPGDCCDDGQWQCGAHASPSLISTFTSTTVGRPSSRSPCSILFRRKLDSSYFCFCSLAYILTIKHTPSSTPVARAPRVVHW